MAAGEQIIDYSIWPTVATSRTIDKRALPCRCQRTQRTAGGLWCGGMTFLFFCRFAIPWHNNMAIPSSEGRILLIGWLVVWGLSSPSSFGAPPRARGLDPAPTQDVDT